ncbi:MAG: ABC transporter ATP-binding protein, partial [Alphaproteobacteria bacterium]|nr:ABC transporter ATP-binding protein [Alphaproteobacteria bacterium]
MTETEAAATPILAIDGLEKHFGGLRAVAGASFSVARGSLTAL